ncbi:MAG: type II secretion system F family protein [Elusimicrobia bacterium]|nr:type II secretion system F family protein [Candidatus Liberimonas magnetica]
MPLFLYTAKNTSGQQVSDTISAENEKAAVSALQSSNLFPVWLKPAKKPFNLPGLFKYNKIGHKDKTLFTRRLADSIKGGLTLTRALSVIERATENEELKKITKEILVMVQEGFSLSQALKKYPEVFPNIYLGMVQAGESAGLLDSVLLKLAEFNEKETELRYRINAALAYPAIMMGVGLLSVFFLLGFVIPRFEVMFQDLGQSIPLPTKILISISNSLRQGWWLYLLIAAALSVFAVKFSRSDKSREVFSKIKLNLPLFGAFFRKDLISRFIRMLSVLLGNGVPVLEALALAKNSIGNRVFEQEIEKIYKSVKDGHGLVEPITKSRFFPPMVSEMISIGDETGRLEESLAKTADTYDREVEYSVKTLTTLLEPVIILFAGIVVCFIAISMLLPVFQMSTGIR